MPILYQHNSEEGQNLYFSYMDTIARRSRAYTYPL